MALQITLVKTPGNVSIPNPTQTFNERGGTLGRGDSNTWVLPDPDKFLSSCHCEIKFEGNGYVLLDLSTNGTFLNSSHEPLGRGNGAPLRDGDFFEIGDYRFAAKVIQGQGFANDSPFAPRDFAPLPSSSGADDIFGSANSNSLFADPFNSAPLVQDFAKSAQGESVDPLVALDRARKTPASTPGFDSFSGNSSFDHNFSGGDIFGQRAKPAAADNDYFGSMDASISTDQAISWPEASQENLIPDDWEDDLLSSPAQQHSFSSPARPPVKPAAAIPKPARAAPPRAQPNAFIPDNAGIPDNFLSDDSFAAEDPFGAPPFEAQTPFDSPADFNNPVAFNNQGAFNQPAAFNDQADFASNTGFENSDFENSEFGDPAAFNRQPADTFAAQPFESQPPVQVARPVVQPVVARPDAARPIAQLAARPAPAQHPTATVAPAQLAPKVEAALVASNNPADNRLIAAMGLDASRLTPEDVDNISDMAGELMREIIDGMMQVLRSRTSIKNEFRMNVTTIQPVENNPLKFSVGLDEALENMFIKKSNAYKKPVDAFREGFQEIGEHQVAMIAGIRHGFERMMERFNPEILEKNFNKQGKTSVIPGVQKAKYWNSYADYYSGFVDNMESSFQHLFGSDFVHAYEDQLRKLIAARKINK